MERMNFFAKSGNAMRALNGFPAYLSKSTIDPVLQHLVYIHRLRALGHQGHTRQPEGLAICSGQTKNTIPFQKAAVI